MFDHLNEDVLAIIASTLSTRDALSLSATARGVHLVAKHQALSSISMSNERQTARICEYLLADVEGRLRWLRNLTIWAHYYTRDRASVNYLAAILSQAHNLKTLSLSPVEEPVKNEPRVGTALAALIGLREVNLSFVELKSLDVIRNMRSDLRKVCVEHYEASASCIPLLKSLSSMQKLHTLEFHQDLETIETSPPQSNRDIGVQWPTVHHLSIKYCTASLSALVRAFPNLRTLSAQNTRYSPRDDSPVCWPSLHSLEGSVQDLQHWEWTCLVHHLSLTSILAIPIVRIWRRPTRSGDEDLAPTLNIVRNTSPTIMTFSIMVYPEHASSFWIDFANVAGSLRCLEIQLCEFHSAKNMFSRLISWMDVVPPVLAELSKLKHIHICISTYMDSKPEGQFFVETYPLGKGPPFPDALAPDHGIAQTLASMLAKHLPSVDLISVGFRAGMSIAIHAPLDADMPFFDESWWWRATGTGDERKTEEMFCYAGKRLRDQLVLSA